MTRTVPPGRRSGTVQAPASKSQAHRLLICAALGQGETRVRCPALSRDTAATARCLAALGAGIRREGAYLTVTPIPDPPAGVRHLFCGESGSTLRFLLPVAGALGARAVFHMAGRLPLRPLAPLAAALTDRGMTIRREGDALFVSGQLRPGSFSLPGDVSSQYLSGLLMALPILPGPSRLTWEGTLGSKGYVDMTCQALARGGIRLCPMPRGWTIPGRQRCALPRETTLGGDWSNAAFFLCMGALSPRGVTVRGLDLTDLQGDRAVLDILREMGAAVTASAEGVCVRSGGGLRGVEIDAGPIPDLIPALCVTAAAAQGESRIAHAGRLRLKESDRLSAVAALLKALGGRVQEQPEGLRIRGSGGLAGGCVQSRSDHRIAMSAALAACICRRAAEVEDSQCVDKSYPDFWQVFDTLRRETP